MACIDGGGELAALLQHPPDIFTPRAGRLHHQPQLRQGEWDQGPLSAKHHRVFEQARNSKVFRFSARVFLHTPCHFVLAGRIDKARRGQFGLSPALTASAVRACGRIEPRPNMRTGSVAVFRGPKPRGRGGLEDTESGVARETCAQVFPRCNSPPGVECDTRN